MYIFILSKAIIVIEGVPGGGSSPEFVLVIFMQNGAILANTYLCINERIELPFFETNGYLHRDVGEASNFFFQRKLHLCPLI